MTEKSRFSGNGDDVALGPGFCPRVVQFPSMFSGGEGPEQSILLDCRQGCEGPVEIQTNWFQRKILGASIKQVCPDELGKG